MLCDHRGLAGCADRVYLEAGRLEGSGMTLRFLSAGWELGQWEERFPASWNVEISSRKNRAFHWL